MFPGILIKINAANRWRYTIIRSSSIVLGALLMLTGLAAVGHDVCVADKSAYRVGILMAGDNRQAPVEGFKDALIEHGKSDNSTYDFIIKNAAGDRDKLLLLAREIIERRPAIAFAAGGIEADALKEASAGSGVPVLFLAASSLERGLVESMIHPGGNMTGVDTNDTALTAKRLWYLRKLFPDAHRVTCFNISSIAPSRESIAIARQVAPSLGFELKIIEVNSKADAIKAATSITRDNTDVILLMPVAPIDQIVRDTLLPLSLKQKIPIFGYNQESVVKGAFAAYGSSREACGAQVARLAVKILHGVEPTDIPAETPDLLELTVNRWLVSQLELQLSNRVWRMIHKQVEISF